MAQITIDGVSFDPVTLASELAAGGLFPADASQSNYIIIQTEAPPSDEQRSILTGAGVAIHEYIPDDTYLCRYEPADLEPIRALPFVTWVSVFPRWLKIAPGLWQTAGRAGTTILPSRVGPPRISRRPRKVDVVFHSDVETSSADLAARVAAVVGVDVQGVQMGRHKVRLTVEEGRLEDLAGIDEVRRIEEVPVFGLANNVARPIIEANVVVGGTTYQGAGQVIAQADTGFDQGSTTNVHPAFTGRVAKLYALGRTSPPLTNDPQGHGTHVAGSALGNGNSATMGGAIQGTAPKAHLVLQSLLDPGGGLGGLPADLNNLFEPPYTNDDARVHTNSWGSNFPSSYDSSASEVDDFVWNHPDMVICFAAGNNGVDLNPANGVVDLSSISSPGVAKNCITVGASESDRPRVEETYGDPDVGNGFFPDPPISNDPVANAPQGMVAFSSRGPTVEGRFKPDVVAPGTCILSTRSRDATSVSPEWGASSDPLFFFDSGTSMATPLTAGCCAVLRETLVSHGVATPSAALIKALLINGAVELVGQYTPSEAGPSPNYNSGWGRVCLACSVIIPGPHPNAGSGEGGPLTQGQSSSFPITVPDDPTLKVTLVWSDPAGAGLQNDLDLIVRHSNGQERHGNMGTSPGFDRKNNVEQVLWTGMPPGHVEVTINAFRITQFPQPYAYAWRIS
jgi:serine protease AprX